METLVYLFDQPLPGINGNNNKKIKNVIPGNPHQVDDQMINPSIDFDPTSGLLEATGPVEWFWGKIWLLPAYLGNQGFPWISWRFCLKPTLMGFVDPPHRRGNG